MKRLRKRSFSRALAMLLALTMTATMLPETVLYVQAEEASAVESAEESTGTYEEGGETGEALDEAEAPTPDTVDDGEVLAAEENAVGEFSDVNMNWYGAFLADINGYFTAAEGAEGYISSSIVQYNAAGEILNEQTMPDFYSSQEAQSFSGYFYPYQDMVRVELKASGTVNGETVNTVYQVYERTNTLRIVFAADAPQVGQRTMRTTVTLEESNLRDFSEFDYCTIKAIIQYARTDSEEWQYTSPSSYVLTSYSDYFSEKLFLGGLEAATSYKAKVILYASGNGSDAYDPENCVFIQEIDLGEFTTTENPTQGAGFKDLEVGFTGFRAFVSGNYEISSEVENVSFYLVQYDAKGNEIFSSQEVSVYIDDEGYGFTDYDGYVLDSDTRKVSVKAVERYYGQSDEEEPMERESEPFVRNAVPSNVEFTVGDILVGVASISIPMTYTGDLAFGDQHTYEWFNTELSYSAKGYADNGQRANTLGYSKDDAKDGKVLAFSGLTSGTTYTATLRLSVQDRVWDSASGGYLTVTAFEQVIELPEFTMKENKTHQVADIFPDEAFRDMVLSNAYLPSYTTEITDADLERISSIYSTRNDFGTPAVKSIAGIEYLTGLVNFDLGYHEVSDVSSIDWSKLVRLYYLNLNGNDLAEIPDLSQNKALKTVSLDYNMIPAEELAKASVKLPAGVILSDGAYTSQRVGGLQIVTEDTYYQLGGKSPLAVKVTGYKMQLPYKFKAIVDKGTDAQLEVEFTWQTANYTNGGYIFYSVDTGIALGSHTMEFGMYAEDELVKSLETEFVMDKGGAYTGKVQYFYNVSSSKSMGNIRVYTDKMVSAVYLKDGNTTVARHNGMSYSMSNDVNEYRYRKLTDNGLYMAQIPGYIGYAYYLNFESLKIRGLDAGTYDLVLEYADGTEETIEDLVRVTSTAVIQSAGMGYNYDSTGDYIYLSLTGSGFDPSKLNYTFTDLTGKIQSASYVNARETYDGYVVKFRKSADWTPKRGESVRLTLAPKQGYEVILENDTFSLYINAGIYYCAYNELANRLEVAIAADFKSDNLKFRFGSADAYYGEIIEEIDVICNGSDTLYYLTPMKDGVSYTLPAGYYRLEAESNGAVSSNSFNVYRYSSSSSYDYWSGTTSILEGTERYNFWYYSSIPYNADDTSKFRAELTGEGLTAQAAESVWTYQYNGITEIGMSFDKLSKLAAGTYTINLYYNDKKLSSCTVRIVASGKFIMTSDHYASWIDSNSFQVWVYTLNVADSDQYTISLTDIDGNLVSGLKTTVLYRSANSVSLKVTGLKREDAYRYYYISVKHNKLGEPYRIDGETKYYTDELGLYTSISNQSTYTSTSFNSRMAGIGIYDTVTYPVTLKVYKPYDTDEIASVQITKNDVSSGNPAWYYFKQSLIDALPDPDGLYDVFVVDKNGVSQFWSEQNIGLNADQQASWTVSPAALTLELGSEELGSGTITVSGNSKAPTFKSDNTDVATVKVNTDNKNQATVTAVGKGSTTITVTADGKTKTVSITVTKTAKQLESFAIRVGNSGIAEIAEISKGASATIYADITPADAWTAESRIKYESDDTDVVKVEESAGKTCKVKGVNPGTATITAVLYSGDAEVDRATCKVKVLNVVDGGAEIEKIGALYFLEGADESLADLKLPAGWTWSNPDEKPVADDALAIQLFQAVYSEEGSAPFATRLPVHVSKVKDLSIGCEQTAVTKGGSVAVNSAYQYVGYNPADAKEVADDTKEAVYNYQITYQWTVGPENNLEITSGQNSSRADVKVNATGTVQLKMIVKNNKTGKTTVLSSAEFTVQALDADMEIVLAAAQPEKGAMDLSDENVTWDSAVILKIDGAAYDKKSASKLALAVSGADSAAAVKWASSDTAVMAVDKKGIVTVKKYGMAVITATVGEQTAELEIWVLDYTPVLENKSITVYQYNMNPTLIGLVAQNGNEIKDVKIKDAASAEGTAPRLIVEQENDGEWYLGAENYAAKKTENITLIVTTADGKSEELALKVVVDVTKPDAKTIKFKQTVKPNIFYCGDEAIDAEFTVSSSKYVITGIESADPSASKQYVVKSYDPVTGKLVLEADGLAKDTLEAKTFSSAAEVSVTVQGYEEAVTIPLKVNTQNKKPSLKMGDATFISGVTDAEVNLYSGKTAVDTGDLKFGDVNVKGDALDLTPTDDGRVSVEYHGKNSGSYKVTVRKETWTSEVTVSGKVSVVDAKKLALEASVSKITINLNEDYNEPVTVSVSVKNNSTIPVTLNATDSKNVLTIVEESDDTFEISAPEGAKKGSYKVKITGAVGGVAVKPVTVTVTLTDKAPEVKVSAKGSINLANRSGTSIVYTPTIKNLPATLSVEDVELDEASSRLFSVDMEGGKAVVRALDGTKLIAKQKYSVNMTFILDNGMEVTTAKAVTITPVDKLPKVKVTNVSTNLYKTNDTHEAKYVLSPDKGYTISRLNVEADKKGVYQNFDVTLNDDYTVSVNLNNNNLKTGTYTLTCQVIITEADNSKPVKVKLKVVVK